MKIISWNVNGIRSVYNKGFLDWLAKEKPDVLCLQEIKIDNLRLPDKLRNIKGYHAFFSHAKKPGYSGVAVYTKIRPKKVESRLGLKQFDDEGRIIRLDFEKFSLINLYLPHGGRGKERLGYKLAAYKKLFSYLKNIKNQNIILIGDFNIAHQELDLARPRANKNNIMFTREERGRLDQLIKMGFLDSFRHFHKEGGHYTWWPYFARARSRNLGWRIDYVFISMKMNKKTSQAFILPKVTGSDHCPVGVKIKL